MEERNILLGKSDAKTLLRMYFQKRACDGRCVDVDMAELHADLVQLLDNLPAYNLQKVADQLKEKRHWSAAEIVEGGWKR